MRLGALGNLTPARPLGTGPVHFASVMSLSRRHREKPPRWFCPDASCPVGPVKGDPMYRESPDLIGDNHLVCFPNHPPKKTKQKQAKLFKLHRSGSGSVSSSLSLPSQGPVSSLSAPTSPAGGEQQAVRSSPRPARPWVICGARRLQLMAFGAGVLEGTRGCHHQLPQQVRTPRFPAPRPASALPSLSGRPCRASVLAVL